VRPDLCQVERIEPVVRGVGEHHLHLDGPGREVVAGDGLLQVADVCVWFLDGDDLGVGVG
jgi:hypothetical protein